jgi:hypothetical protein
LQFRQCRTRGRVLQRARGSADHLHGIASECVHVDRVGIVSGSVHQRDDRTFGNVRVVVACEPLQRVTIPQYGGGTRRVHPQWPDLRRDE